MMHIPDKYRERYDRLALTHPWMREMRDEQPLDGDVLHELRHYENDVRYDYDPLDDVFEPDERLSELCGQVADMLECRADAPEGDAVAIMRRALDNQSSPTFCALARYLGISGGLSVSWTEAEDALRVLADMVERDYVSREAYEDLRDEFTWTNSFLHRVGKQCGTKDVPSLKAYVEQLEAERDELKSRHCPHYHVDRHYCDVHETRIKELIAERDKWKAKAEQAERAMNVAAGKWARADARSAERAAAVERLDGVEQATDENLLDAILGAPAGLNLHGAEKLITLKALLTDGEGSSKVRVGQSKVRVGKSSAKRAAAVARLRNFESSAEGDGYYWDVTHALLGKRPTEYDNSDELISALIDLLTDEPMDAEQDANGTRPNANGTASDDCGHSADMSQKSADCVREGGEMSEVGANLGSEPSTLEDFEGKGSEVDSREKLEADVLDYQGAWPLTDSTPINVTWGIVRGWFDRLTAIVERECREYEDALREQHHKRVAILRASLEDAEFERDELQSKLDDDWRGVALKKQVDLLKAERDYWKSEVEWCMRAAYPPSHAPEPPYNPNVMAYPDREGCTTPSTMVGAKIDELRDKLTDIAKVMMA